MNNKTNKLIILIFSLIIIMLPVYAANTCNLSNQAPDCEICISTPGNLDTLGVSLTKSDCTGGVCNFNLISTSDTLTITDSNFIFQRNAKCSNSKINVNLNTNLSFVYDSGTVSDSNFINVKGIDILTINDKNITFLSKSTARAKLIFNLKDINLVVLNNTASIIGKEDMKPNCGGPGYGVALYFSNMQISEGSSNLIKVESAKTQGECMSVSLGNPAYIDGDSIFNYSNDFNIIIIGGDSGNGFSWAGNGTESSASGGKAWMGGNANISLENYFNYGTSRIDMNGGYGGNGGEGNEESNNDGSVGNGGSGGTGGVIFFKISNIINKNPDSNLVMNLITGNGGNGGNTGNDFGGNNSGNYAVAGSGGSGGHISNIIFKSIFNEGNLKMNVIAGNGGNGGAKQNHGCSQDDSQGLEGVPGFGGTVYDLNINVLYNNSNNFNIDLVSGIKGNFANPWSLERPDCPGVSDSTDGNSNNINVNYFTNLKENSINILSVNGRISTNPVILDINYLRPGSYLPKSVNLIKRGYDSSDPLEYTPNSGIVVHGCFIGNQTEKYNFITKDVNLSLKNLSEVLLNINYSKVNTVNYLETNLNCNYCDYNEPGSKIGDVYSLYSNLSGNILPRDMNIYYSSGNGTIPKGIVNPFYSGYPVYTNLYQITGVFDSKYGLYRYEVTPSNLIWYDSPNYDLTIYPDQFPFCQGQQYLIKGSINDTNNFSVPFVPVFKQ